MTEHRLKSWPPLFAAILSGSKRHELRRADRQFAVGDTLLLQEFDPLTQSYTGNEHRVSITYITSTEFPCALSDAGLSNGFCIMSIR